jgi:hypothetical protein
MEQSSLWGDPVQPKQNSKPSQPAQEQPQQMSTDDMVNRTVTSTSSANHIATRLNLAYEKADVSFKRLVDLKKHQEWTDERHKELSNRVDTLDNCIKMLFDEIKVVRDCVAELSQDDFSPEVDMMKELDLSSFDEPELSSPETEARIHGEME